MNWNDAAEDLLNAILARTPRPVREEAENALRKAAESTAEEEGKNRVGVETVVAAWVRSTPVPIRPDLTRQMEQLGLDPDEYQWLLEEN
ncbi:MAG: PCP reductase family protein [Bryobacterales bacterium]|nr:PCP reductase family protein [Bryobacterales bacterium]